jgi:hypothetical protein
LKGSKQKYGSARSEREGIESQRIASVVVVLDRVVMTTAELGVAHKLYKRGPKTGYGLG